MDYSQSKWFSYAKDEHKIIHQSNGFYKRCPDVKAKQPLIPTDSIDVLPSPGYEAAQRLKSAAADHLELSTSSFQSSAAFELLGILCKRGKNCIDR
ncbi:hypothetical protein HC928_21915 [bacterium]|nr:hypothetical protein [bacterium]